MGLDVFLKRGPHNEKDCAAETIEQPSVRYPEHYFKVGYFRSSYNESGFDSCMRQYGLATLDAICGVGNDDYVVVPDWPAVVEQTDAALAAFDAASDRMRYRVFTESFFGGFAVERADAALALFLDEMEKGSSFGAWSSARGYFTKEQLRVHGLIPGRDLIGSPCVYVVTASNAESIARYRQALEIVRETAEWVLAQPDPKAFHLHWSG